MCVCVSPAFDTAIPVAWTPVARANTSGHSMYEYATSVVFNIPPNARLEQYIDSNYDKVQAKVVAFASTVLYSVGFSDVESDLPLLTAVCARARVCVVCLCVHVHFVVVVVCVWCVCVCGVCVVVMVECVYGCVWWWRCVCACVMCTHAR